MRGLVPGLVNPYPLATHLPAAYQGDAFTEQFLSVFDDVLAPVLTTLDTIDAYLTPAVTPPDFLPWLASWVGVELDQNWSEEQQRRLVSEAVSLLQWRGTRRGAIDLIRSYLAVADNQVDVDDTGGVAWSATPGGAIPGTTPPRVVVRVRTDDPEAIDPTRLERLVAATVPAHVAHEVEVVAT
jgi:phage tail-like protein